MAGRGRLRFEQLARKGVNVLRDLIGEAPGCSFPRQAPFFIAEFLSWAQAPQFSDIPERSRVGNPTHEHYGVPGYWS
jgi:hypothetical protein